MFTSLRLYRRLHAVLAGATRNELRKKVEFLKAENEVLRSHLKGPIRTTPRERRRLVKLGSALGSALKEVLTIVNPATFARWVREGRRSTAVSSAQGQLRRRRGRPMTAERIRTLVIRMARESGLGYTRLLGELRKLGLRGISRTTVGDILRSAGIPPAPERRDRTWSEFLHSHVATLWACDFFATRIVTPRGIRLAFVMVFLHVGSRRLIVSPATLRPTRHWVAAQTNAWLDTIAAQGERIGPVLRDRDTKFGRSFDAALARAGAAALQLPIRSPNLNAHVERVIQTIRHECLDHFVVMGRRHMNHLLAEFTRHYNRERPHSSLDFRPPGGAPPPPMRAWPASDHIVHCTRLGGVLHHYERRAA